METRRAWILWRKRILQAVHLEKLRLESPML
jgi:hypothetical protein